MPWITEYSAVKKPRPLLTQVQPHRSDPAFLFEKGLLESRTDRTDRTFHLQLPLYAYAASSHFVHQSKCRSLGFAPESCIPNRSSIPTSYRPKGLHHVALKPGSTNTMPLRSDDRSLPSKSSQEAEVHRRFFWEEFAYGGSCVKYLGRVFIYFSYTQVLNQLLCK